MQRHHRPKLINFLRIIFRQWANLTLPPNSRSIELLVTEKKTFLFVQSEQSRSHYIFEMADISFSKMAAPICLVYEFGYCVH